MKLTYGKILNVIFALVFMTSTVCAGNINMMVEDNTKTEIKNTIVFGAEVNSYYYTVILNDGIVQKIELNGAEETEFNINTDTETILEVIKNYDKMSWLDKVKYLTVDMKIPTKYIIDYVGNMGEV